MKVFRREDAKKSLYEEIQICQTGAQWKMCNKKPRKLRQVIIDALSNDRWVFCRSFCLPLRGGLT